MNKKVDNTSWPGSLVESFDGDLGGGGVIVPPKHRLHDHKMATFVSRPGFVVLETVKMDEGDGRDDGWGDIS